VPTATSTATPPADRELELDWLDDLVATHREQLGVPGVTVAVLHDGAVATSVSGVANLNTGAPVTPDTRFLIGSISKVVTGTLLLQHLDRGELELDAPVRGYLPEFRIADAEATEAITIRHLLTHTSGIEGDHFEDFGRGDDAIDRYLESVAKIGLIHDVGALFSYCNTGWVVAGRVLETLRGQRYRNILKESLLPVLGMTQTTTAPEETILHAAAVGHVDDGSGELRATSVYALPASMGPAGTVLCSTPRDLLRFAQLHIDEGRAPDGNPFLSPETARAMREPQAEIPVPSRNTWIGLGWLTMQREATTFISHSGGTTGQFSQLLVAPEHGFAIASQTNGPNGRAFNSAIGNEVTRRLVGTTAWETPSLDQVDDTVDLDRYVGVYERLSMRATVARHEDGLRMTSIPVGTTTSDEAEAKQEVLDLAPLDETFFVARNGEGAAAAIIGFLLPDEDGRPTYAYAGRIARRVG